MEVANWKKVLLEWANCTGFLERYYYNLSQTNIEAFFNEFKSHISSIQINETEPTKFIKVHYPQFECTLFTDDNHFIVDDYIYVYSLFLHFSCVKYPELEIQKTCQNMKDITQPLIASFLQTLIGKNSFDKESILQAIMETIPSKMPKLDLFSPTKSAPGILFSPPTPKSKMLEDWNSENKHLKALIETERYEKGLLEVQIRQSEEKIDELSKERKKIHAEIHDLKNKLLVKNTENISPNRNGNEEVIKRRLRKEIADKEEKIVQLQLSIEDVKDESTRLSEKIRVTDKQVKVLQDKITEMNFTLDDAHVELERKDEIINYLQNANKDLETFISDMRSSNGHLDASVECLDNSFVNNGKNVSFTTISRPSGSPENLGRAVVDVQLREQQSVNQQLTDRLNNVQKENENLSSQITNLIMKHKNELHDCELKLNNLNIEHNSYLTKINEQFAETTNSTKSAHSLAISKCEEQIAELSNERNSLNNKIDQNEKKMNELNSVILEFTEKYNKSEIQCNQLHQELVDLKKIVVDLGQNLTVQQSDNNALTKAKQELSNVITTLSDQIRDLENQKKINEENVKLKLSCEMFEKSLGELNGKYAELSDQKRLLNDENVQRIQLVGQLQNEIDQLTKFNDQLEDDILSVKLSLQELAQEKAVNLSALNESACKIDDYESQINKLQKENLNCIQQIEKLNEIITDLQNKIMDFEGLNQTLNLTINELDTKIVTVETEKSEKIREIEEKNSNYLNTISNLNIEMGNLQKNLEEITANYDNTTTAIRNMENDRSKLEIELENRNRNYLNLKVELDKQTQECDNLNLKFNRSEECNSELRSENSKYSEEIKIVNLERDEIKDQLKHAEGMLVEIKSKLLNSETEKSAISLTNTELLATIADKDRIILQLKDEIEVLKNDLNNTRLKLTAAETEKSQIIQQNADLLMEIETDGKVAADLRQQLEKYSNDCANLKISLATNVQEKTDILSKNENLLADAEQKENTIFDLNKQIKNMLNENESIIAKLTISQEEKSVLLCDATEQLAALDTNKMALAALTNKYSEAEAKINALTSQVSLLKEEKSKIFDQNTEILAAKGCTQKTMNYLKSQLDNTTTELKKCQCVLSELESKKTIIIEENKQLQNDLNDSKQTAAMLQERSDSLTREIDSLNLKLTETDDEKSKLMIENKNLLIDLQKSREACDTVAATFNNSSVELSNLNGKISQLEKEIQLKAAEQKRSLDTMLAETEQSKLRIADVENEKSTILIELADQKTKYSDLEHQLSTIMNEKEILTNLNEQLKQKVVDCERSLQEYQETAKDMEEGNRKLVEMKASLESKVETIISEKHEMRRKFENASMNVNSLKNENKQLCDSVERIKSEFTNIYNTYEGMGEKLDSFARGIDSKVEMLNDKCNQVVCQKDQAKEAVQKLILDNDRLKSSVQFEVALVQQLQQENQELTNKISELTNELSSAENDAKAQLLQTTQQIELLTTKLNQCEAEKVEHLNIVQKLEGNIGKIETENASLKSNIDDLLENIVEFTDRGVSLETSLVSLKHDNDELTLAVQQKTNILQENDRKYGLIYEDYKRMEAKLEILQARAVDLDSQTKRINELNSELVQRDEQIATLKQSALVQQSSLDQDKSNIKSFKQQIDELNMEKCALEKKVKELSKNLNEFTQNLDIVKSENVKLVEENVTLLQTIEKHHNNYADTLAKFTVIESESDGLKSSCEEITKNLIDHKTENSSLKECNEKLLRNVNELSEENSQKQDKLSKLTIKVDILTKEKENLFKEIDTLRQEHNTEGCTMKQTILQLQQDIIARDDRLNRLNDEAQKTVQVKHKEYESLCEKEKELSHAVAILQAKLMKHRENSAAKEKEWMLEKENLISSQTNAQFSAEERIKENRHELEGKLEKMKAKMKDLYSDQISKIKTKHENEIFEFKAESHQRDLKIEQYESHVKKLSMQILQLNEKHLEFQRDNEFMKNKLRFIENNPHRSSSRMMPSLSIGSNLKMEDEEGELFNNTYLADLKAGITDRRSPTGRDSVRLSELKYRNSLVQPHLRSTYAAQYTDQEYREEDVKIDGYLGGALGGSSSIVGSSHDESISSNHSDLRRGTIYKRPGPPTPSKSGARLSFGANEQISAKEILKEANANSKKTTPGKLRSLLFSTSKVKDENSTPKQKRFSLLRSRNVNK